jgi:regulator of RNase E activity RraA
VNSLETARAFATLSTPAVADACLRLGLPLRLAPQGLVPVVRGARAAGRVLPARHAGSVDVFLEAFVGAAAGDVLVIDNGGRRDEACIGDLTAIEAQAAGLAAIVLWGVHRDTAELVSVGLPVWSYGTFPTGPRRLDPRPGDALARARFGEETVEPADLVFADDDGALFVSAERAPEVLAAAEAIAGAERGQARAVREGRTLRQQFRFDEYLAARRERPTLTFREYLSAIGGAIEV